MSTFNKISIRYGREKKNVLIPEEFLLDEIGMREIQAAQSPLDAIEYSLDHPIGCDRLEELVVDKSNIVILVDDMTRPTPVHQILPSLCRRILSTGISQNAVTILVATGTHRPMTEEELEVKIGADILNSYKVLNHNYRDLSQQIDLGNTPSGIPITVNKLVAQADFVIGVGNIVPHRYCGWAGGAKIIQPGVGGEATTAGTHLMITKDPDIRLGIVENRVRHEMETVAEHVNLKFIVNTILDRDANIVEVVCGDYRLAFRKGVEIARNVYSAPTRAQSDIVLASAFPSDINLWQAGKAFYSAELVVKKGGIIILASPCYEGVGEHGEFIDLLQYNYQEIENLLESGKVKDRIGAAAALAVALVIETAEIWLVTKNISDEQAKRINMNKFNDIQEAVNRALKRKGTRSKVTVMHEATEILPIIEKEKSINA